MTRFPVYAKVSSVESDTKLISGPATFLILLIDAISELSHMVINLSKLLPMPCRSRQNNGLAALIDIDLRRLSNGD